MLKDRAARIPPTIEAWWVRLAIDNDGDPYFPLRREVATYAHECRAAHEAIAAFTAAVAPPASAGLLGGRVDAKVIVRKPEFVELARGLASAFEELTAAVDACMQQNVPWRDLIDCEPILRALDAGIEKQQQIIRSRAYAKFLREGGMSPLS
ncbi:hypothetical protein [Rhizobium sp. RAF56]|uniref:hypothetical protein n=1 Tax=Rhizobium sp. RAF56 TaxID=3233062 RepID=UPI003F999F38